MFFVSVEITSKLMILMLIYWAGIGIAHLIDPDYFVRRFLIRKGGATVTAHSRAGFRLIGLVHLVCTAYVASVFFSK
jgi:hypothetical protein